MGTFTPSKYQQDVFDFISNQQGHLVVEAVAGSGKSTTLVQAAKLLPPNAKALFAAFNNHIAKELGEKLREAGSTMECRTVHSLGKSILDRQVKSGKIDGNKYRNLCREYLQTKGYDLNSFTQDMYKLVDAVRLTLTNPRDEKAINAMILHYGIDIDFEYAWDDVLAGIPEVLKLGKKMYEAGVIDFTDMLYLPATLDIPCPKYDVLMLDECQDFNAAQLALIMKCCASSGRMIFVGDVKQAIQGFAFADTNSVQNILDKTQAARLPLSICYRCAKNVVYMAQQLVPSIESAETAEEGIIEAIRSDQFLSLVEPGDMVICRTTAPLVSQCLTLLRAGIKAMVRGKDIGKSFIDIIKKLQKRRGFCFEALGDLVETYHHEQLNILMNVPDNEMKVASLNDKVDTFVALLEAYLNKVGDNGSIVGFEEYINSFFTDDDGNGSKPVMFSTVHKSKGLESNRVFILEPRLFPHPAAKKVWQLEQEYNIEYVAITRAKKELYFVGGLPTNLHFRQDDVIQDEMMLEAPIAIETTNDTPETVETVLELSEDVTEVPETVEKKKRAPGGGRKPKGRKHVTITLPPSLDSRVNALDVDKSALIEMLLEQHLASLEEIKESNGKEQEV